MRRWGRAVSDADAARARSRAAPAVRRRPGRSCRQAGRPARGAGAAPDTLFHPIASPPNAITRQPRRTSHRTLKVRRVISAHEITRSSTGCQRRLSPKLRCGSNRGSEMKCDDLPEFSRKEHSQVASESVGLRHRTAPTRPEAFALCRTLTSTARSRRAAMTAPLHRNSPPAIALRKQYAIRCPTFALSACP